MFFGANTDRSQRRRTKAARRHAPCSTSMMMQSVLIFHPEFGPKKCEGWTQPDSKGLFILLFNCFWGLTMTRVFPLNHNKFLFQDSMIEAYNIIQPKSQCITWYWILGTMFHQKRWPWSGCLMGKQFKRQVPLSGSEDEHRWSISRSIFRF